MQKHIKLFEDMFVGSEGNLGNDDREFNFNHYQDTNLDGAGFEMIVDEMIKDAENELTNEFGDDELIKRKARAEISRLWSDKIMEWASK